MKFNCHSQIGFVIGQNKKSFPFFLLSVRACRFFYYAKRHSEEKPWQIFFLSFKAPNSLRFLSSLEKVEMPQEKIIEKKPGIPKKQG